MTSHTQVVRRGGQQPEQHAGRRRVRGDHQGGHMGQPAAVLPHDRRGGRGGGNRRRGPGRRGL